ncbi:hypothetical protein [Sphingobacterium hotanense]|uniref:DUF4157 domain-containing protein n=1 Tax=Sphingobacterium hotanense TaxID=649196 RepID=A0ABT7NQF3_9SPHI|nr:hypothetical protein [Sphingobacterium hotanense]MDM1049462.1 hypothetical protein [Sphingobacterium hotanense]
MKGKVIVSSFWTRFFSFGKAQAITIFPFIFLRYRIDKADKILINHERIHIIQALELLVIPFYIWYLSEFLYRYIQHRDFNTAYFHISFEREAYSNQHDMNYLKKRKRFGFLAYWQ